MGKRRIMDLKENIIAVNSRIAEAANRSGRSPEDIKLVVVTKTRSINIIESAIDFDIRYIGENKVQEAEQKIPLLQDKIDEFHFIGHLQTNKIRKLLALKPDLIHSIDNFKTATKLNDHMLELDLIQEILIQVNTSGEETKSGVEPDLAIELIKNIRGLSNIKIMGLMTIGLLTSDQSKIRDCFRRLKDLATEVMEKKISNTEMKYLSMGMTDDFEIAIEEGANIVRIGSAIFGPRSY